MKLRAADINRSFAIAKAMDPEMGSFSLWEPASILARDVSERFGESTNHAGWVRHSFDHSRLDALSALAIMGGETAMSEPSALVDVSPFDLRFRPSRRLIRRLRGSACRYPFLGGEVETSRCLVRTPHSRGGTLALLSALHALAQRDCHGAYSSVTVTVSAGEEVRRSQIGNLSSGYLCTVTRGESVEKVCGQFLHRAKLARNASLIRLSAYGKIERLLPGFVAWLGRTSMRPREAAILSSLRVPDGEGSLGSRYFLEIPSRSPQSVGVGVIQDSRGCNVCISGRATTSSLVGLAKALFSNECDILYTEGYING
jgi:hypothetical protein